MVMGACDAEAIREQFPLLANNPGLVYLDSAATSQVPSRVLDAVVAFETGSRANIHRGLYALAEQATDAYENARAAVAEHFGCDTDELVFTHGATDSLNLAVSSWAMDNLAPDDLVVVDAASHHSAMVPLFIAAKRTGARVELAEVDESGALNEERWQALLDQGPKAVALTHTSNVTGATCDLARLAAQAHATGAMVFAACAPSAPHQALDFHKLGVDFAAVSAHKMYGPFGIGALYMNRAAQGACSPSRGGGGMVRSVSDGDFVTVEGPSSFEAGTPNIAGAVGFAEACSFLEDLDRTALCERERELCNQVMDVTASIRGARVLGPSEPNSHDAVVSFAFADVHPHDMAEALGEAAVAVRAGNHCAMPLHDRLGTPASLRVSFGAYSTERDVESFAVALLKAWEELR